LLQLRPLNSVINSVIVIKCSFGIGYFWHFI
jgi:hypothetical protein